MRLSKMTIITDLDGFITTLRYFEGIGNPAIDVEHSKYAAEVQMIGPKIVYDYEINISTCKYPAIDLLPILKDLEERIKRESS